MDDHAVARWTRPPQVMTAKKYRASTVCGMKATALLVNWRKIYPGMKIRMMTVMASTVVGMLIAMPREHVRRVQALLFHR